MYELWFEVERSTSVSTDEGKEKCQVSLTVNAQFAVRERSAIWIQRNICEHWFHTTLSILVICTINDLYVLYACFIIGGTVSLLVPYEVIYM